MSSADNRTTFKIPAMIAAIISPQLMTLFWLLYRLGPADPIATQQQAQQWQQNQTIVDRLDADCCVVVKNQLINELTVASTTICWIYPVCCYQQWHPYLYTADVIICICSNDESICS